ncbi:MAG TPA: excinuclease ABC subunit UvrC [Candidatus Limnocylindria bacterium]|nr:excinuclease ABC subunit UvrC [Candidatus Limnocylindria bacterium]
MTIVTQRPQLQAILGKLPNKPGVYLLKDARGQVLYVGKAKSLRSRVRSYWQKEAPGVEQHLIRSVIDRVADVDYTITDSVAEALLLEGNLVKRFQPPFNVRLKDDKSYPYIKITNDDFPRIERTRKLPNDGSRYFGPYASASSVDEAMNLVRRLFPFRTCTIDIREGERALQRPCLLYHIKRCQGPCIEAISKAEYRADIEQVELFLEGRQESLVKALRDDMARASERQDYEHAAITRDKIKAVERTMESQKMAAFARTDLDLVGLARRDNQAAVQLFVIRGGKALGRDVYLLDTPRGATDAEVVSSFLLQYYGRATSVPPEIALPILPPDGEDLERFLSDRRGGVAPDADGSNVADANVAEDPNGDRTPADLNEGSLTRTENLTVPRPDAVRVTRQRKVPAGVARPVRLMVPQRGERRQLMQLATRNAEEMLAREQARWLADQGKTLGALEELASALGLSGLPARIECYDVSNFQGSETVASMVVFEDGKPQTGEYRRFRVRTVEGPNDVASHREVLRRRFRSVRPGDEGSAEERRWAMPDLVLIDGGKPQVGAAKGVLNELGLHELPLAGIAKEREELFRPDESEPIVLPSTSQALYLVQRIRDEAHRFAITYHRDLRRKAAVRSKFDDLPGIGPRRRGALLRVFGSIKRVREAPLEQIAAVPGIGPALAKSIKAALEE